ncbi:hypothetical protein ABR737_00865 [Streptomyces sp. Edi2]|uniref:hypothetical protein n=1 Tax=Streptomyces sp. Edi2 TaxID=3162528 RepID=UPI0033062504
MPARTTTSPTNPPPAPTYSLCPYQGPPAPAALHIAPWTDEHPVDVPVYLNQDLALTYGEAERPEDRDDDGVLLQRWGGTATGGINWGAHQTHRQTYAVDHLKCAACVQDPDVQRPGHARDPDVREVHGMLWILPSLGRGEDDMWPRDLETTVPPMCRMHAHRAIRDCPELREGYVALRVRESERIGYIGTVYTPTNPPRPQGQRIVRFTEPAIHRVVARQLVRKLYQAEPDSSLGRTATPACDTAPRC